MLHHSFMCTGHIPDLSLLHTFGCCIYILPPRTTHCNKLHSDTCTGIFLSYSQTLKNIIYYDVHSHQVKTTLHLVFDEAMTDLDDKTLNAWLLCGDDVLPREVLYLTSNLQHLDISPSPFTTMVTIEVHYDPNDPVSFGFCQSTCNCLHWAYITGFT